MRKLLSIYIPLIVIVALALLFDAAIPAPLFIGILIAGIAPLFLDIFQSLRAHRIDLGLPVAITIFILIAIGKNQAAAIFVLLILGGRMFKEYILWRVRESVASISQALPDLAFVRVGDEIKELHISAIQKGDIVVVKAGGRVPVDGLLLSDSASLDESVITGESRPVTKKKGTALVAASINLGDALELRATDTSANSTIAQMQKLVEDAQSRNAPLSQFTTRYAEITSVLALILVSLVYFTTKNLEHALALWIALVPVIFALIVPVATTIGISLLARSGVLVKTAEALENLTRIDTLCFDKTGTLTRGKPELTGLIAMNGIESDELLRIAGSMERLSEHSLGEPIVQAAEARHLPWIAVDQIQVHQGQGISASVEGQVLLVGNKDFLLAGGVFLPQETVRQVEEREGGGATPIWVSRGGSLVGIIFLSDQPRAETKPTLARLRGLGYKLVMLTGDQLKVAEKIGADIGVTEVRAGLLPQGKIDSIKSAKSSGRRVLMVGDGINDAPALSEANVGVAMGLRGVGITLESAQVVLVHDNLEVLPHTISVAKETFKIIRLDLILASLIHLAAAILVLFNVIGIIGSTVIHQISSALVLLNTLRLFSVQKETRRQI